MLIKPVESLGSAPRKELLARGHVADRVSEEGLSGATDAAAWERCQKESHYFITLDLDFSAVRRLASGTHCGLLVRRTDNRSHDAVLANLRRLRDEHPLDSLTGALVVADLTMTRMRRPPPNG
jgi:predicted nuclease of predicted toxin-antitoxin system